MVDEKKKEIAEKIQLMLSNASEDRVSLILNLVIFEVNSYDICEIDVAQDEFE